jgi:hypothetical protein
MKSITETRFLATYYSSLQGLRLVPFGLLLLLVSVWANSLYGVIAKDFTLPIVFVFGAALLFIMIDQYYKRAFGDVKRTVTTRRVELVGTVIAGILAVGIFWVNNAFKLPITLLGFIFAAAFLVDNPKANFPLNKFSSIKLAFSICLIIVSILPLYLGADWWNIFGINSGVLGVSILEGILLIGAGVIWHMYFINSLPSTESKDE